jgi:hypothetical protein
MMRRACFGDNRTAYATTDATLAKNVSISLKSRHVLSSCHQKSISRTSNDARTHHKQALVAAGTVQG